LTRSPETVRIAVVHNPVLPEADKADADTLVQLETALSALETLGHVAVALPFEADLAGLRAGLASLEAEVAVNLVEAVEGSARLIHLAPAMLEHLGVPVTGAGSLAMLLSSDKLLAKERLTQRGIPTPAWLAPPDRFTGQFQPGRFIVKPIREHASLGLDEGAILHADSVSQLNDGILRRERQVGLECFAEVYVHGREFNLSMLSAADGTGADVLPLAEMRFEGYSPERPRVLDYKAKWDEDSAEYQATRRAFGLERSDPGLAGRLRGIALACWDAFGLRGYARVDVRVDDSGVIFVIDVNANPCLSPDAGFMAAAGQEGIALADVFDRMLTAATITGLESRSAV